MVFVKNFYKRLKLQGKILILFIPAISLTMVFTNIFAGEVISRILVQKSFAYTLDKMSLLTRQYHMYEALHGGGHEVLFFFDGMSTAQKETYVIVDGKGKVISASNRSMVNKDVSSTDYYDWVQKNNLKIKVFTVDEERYVIVGSHLGTDNYLLLDLQLVESILTDNKEVTYSIYVTAIICIVLIVCIAIVFSESVTAPIHRLSAQMKEVSNGNLDSHIDIDTNDEMGDLSVCFNTMLTRLKALITKIENEQKIIREYELSLLHAQIKPHFLYNTLESVRALILGNKNKLAFETISNLGNFYKGILNGGSDILTVEDEIKITENYLKIQQVRYEGLFDFSVSVDEDVLKCRIPLLSLQPIVENSIKHGLRGTSRKAKIEISAHRSGNDTIVKVVDNGKGIAKDRLGDLLELRADAGQQGGYGLRNIHERIRLYYGSRYGLTITSDEGTTVSIFLPFNAPEGGGDVQHTGR